MRETICWEEVDHPNLLPFYGAVDDGDHMYFISPWMTGGTLPNYLKKFPKTDRRALVSGTCLYIDDRNEKANGKLTQTRFGMMLNQIIDTMENWDEAKLRSVVLSKAGNPRTTTDVSLISKETVHFEFVKKIVCKFFIDAVESGKYGWFWECPNGLFAASPSLK